MKAITTRYKGPTDTKGSKIIATAEGGHKVTISYPYELSGEDVHAKAAICLCLKLGWKGELIGGGTDKGYVFVFANGERYPITE